MSTVDKDPSSSLPKDDSKNEDSVKSSGRSESDVAQTTRDAASTSNPSRMSNGQSMPSDERSSNGTANADRSHPERESDRPTQQMPIVQNNQRSSRKQRSGQARRDDHQRQEPAPSAESTSKPNVERTASPVDPGLALVASSHQQSERDPKPTHTPEPTQSGAGDNRAQRQERHAEPVRAASADTAEQLVITPVSDRVDSKSDHGQAPTKRVPATETVPERSTATGSTSAGDHHTVPLPSTVARPTSRGEHRRARVRRVTRVVRHIDPWSAFKVGLIFNLVAYVVCLTSGVLLWQVAEQTGTIDNMQGWFTQFGWETFELKGGDVYHNAWIIGLFLAVGGTGVIVLGVTLFNLISDIVGGVRISVLEEEVVERRLTTSRRYAVRRPGVTTGADGGLASGWSVDGENPAPKSPAKNPLASTTTDWSIDD